MLNLIVKRDSAGTPLPQDDVNYYILAGATAIAWVFVIELDLTIFLTFRRRSGLYFWSLLVSSWGCVLHALAFILSFLVGSDAKITLPFIEIGWVTMVTGQAFVLYSRLHLVVRNGKTLRYVLWLIIVDACILHIPTIVFTVGKNSPDGSFWIGKFNVMERIQLVGFCLQEFVISTLYIVSTVRILGSVYHSMTRKVMFQLILINVVCIGMDIVLIGLEFSNNYIGEASIKPMIYAIKLKLEFTVLNQLMGLSKAGFTEGSRWGMGTAGHSNHNHELKERTYNSSTDPEAPPPRRAGQWAVINPRGGQRGSVTAGRTMRPENDDIILKTQDVDVVTETVVDGAGNNKADISNASSSTAVTGASSTSENPPPTGSVSKVKNLMGATPFIPGGRSARQSRPGEHGGSQRAQSPSESEKEICRVSSDDEKGGVWGVGHVE